MSVKRKGGRLPHLGSKGNVGVKAVDIDASFIGTSMPVAVVLLPPAWCYFDMVGTVDLREQGGSYDRGEATGHIYVGDGYIGEPKGWGGWYFDRE